MTDTTLETSALWMGVFVATFFIDFVWAKYIEAVADIRPIVASNWSVLILLLGGITTMSYVKDPWLLIPIGFGGWLGTYVSQIVKQRNEKNTTHRAES